MNLQIDRVCLSKYNHENTNKKIQIQIDENLFTLNDKKLAAFKHLKGKDLANMSYRKYKSFKTNSDSTHMPGIKAVDNLRKKLDKMFITKKNSYGVYCEPSAKIQYVCQKFIEENEHVDDNIFMIKLSSDGTNITKSNLHLINFTFTIINDEKRAKASVGNYILGKKKF